jgi:predicted nucleic acid-binding protein
MREAVLDANVLLRYLTDEPHDQADEVAAMLEPAQSARIELIVTPITLADVVFVLESVYRWERRAIADRLLELISASVLHFVEGDTLTQALIWYRDIGALHFADAYVAAVARARRQSAAVSFDRGMRRVPGIRLIPDATSLPRDR